MVQTRNFFQVSSLRNLYGKMTTSHKKNHAFTMWRAGKTFPEIGRALSVAEATAEVYVIDEVAGDVQRPLKEKNSCPTFLSMQISSGLLCWKYTRMELFRGRSGIIQVCATTKLEYGHNIVLFCIYAKVSPFIFAFYNR